jgi:hypothetical protein
LSLWWVRTFTPTVLAAPPAPPAPAPLEPAAAEVPPLGGAPALFAKPPAPPLLGPVPPLPVVPALALVPAPPSPFAFAGPAPWQPNREQTTRGKIARRLVLGCMLTSQWSLDGSNIRQAVFSGHHPERQHGEHKDNCPGSTALARIFIADG